MNVIEERDLNTLVKLTDHERRIVELESDMKTIKPVVYNTSNSVKQIEKSVEKMEKNSDKIKGYFLAAAITATVTGVVGIILIALQSKLFGG